MQAYGKLHCVRGPTRMALKSKYVLNKSTNVMRSSFETEKTHLNATIKFCSDFSKDRHYPTMATLEFDHMCKLKPSIMHQLKLNLSKLTLPFLWACLTATFLLRFFLFFLLGAAGCCCCWVLGLFAWRTLFSWEKNLCSFRPFFTHKLRACNTNYIHKYSHNTVKCITWGQKKIKKHNTVVYWTHGKED